MVPGYDGMPDEAAGERDGSPNLTGGEPSASELHY
jgi:hypothetical protein